jgi:molybdopterin synthase sulfur carrier subunit
MDLPTSHATVELPVFLFAAVREAVGSDQITIQTPLPTTAAALRKILAQLDPQLDRWLAVSRLAVDRRFVADEDPIESAKEIAVIPPVSGG